MIRHVEAAIGKVGIRTNFSQQKTEVSLCGPGSQALRRQWLSSDCPKLESELCSGEAVQMSLTDRYVHLGSVVHFSGCDFLDAQRRRTLAQIAFAPVKSRLLRNPFLSTQEKLRAVDRVPLRKFLFGAGAWALATRLKSSRHMKPRIRVSCGKHVMLSLESVEQGLPMVRCAHLWESWSLLMR